MSVVSVSLGQEAEHLAVEEAARAVDRTGLALADMQVQQDLDMGRHTSRSGTNSIVRRLFIQTCGLAALKLGDSPF